ncbi:MAG: hypothetical protein ACK4MF_02205 [Hyphomicrobiaceae bacterium]
MRLRDASMAGARGALALMAVTMAALPAVSLEVLPDERAGRKACEKALCAMVVTREAAGGPLACNMVKTWDRDKIKKGGESGKLSWGFGDARCSVAISIPRDQLMPALAEAKYTLQVPTQTVKCEIEGSDQKITTINVEANPKIEFVGGKAEKLWLNVGKVDGDSIATNFVWAATKLIDNLGLFHSAAIAEINSFVHDKCPQIHAGKDE